MAKCIVCGNTKKSDLERTILYSDDEGNDCEKVAWLCKEDKGCNK